MEFKELKKEISKLAEIETPIIVPTFEQVTKGNSLLIIFNYGVVLELVNDLSLEYYDHYESILDISEQLEYYEQTEDLLPFIKQIFPNAVRVYINPL